MESSMGSGMLQVVGMSLLLCALLICIIFTSWIRGRKLPPGPRGLPIIGHLHLMRENPHHMLHKLSQRYGPLFSLRFGSIPVIVASSPETARQILKVHDHTFSSRLPTAVALHLTGFRNILTAPSGPYLNFVRHICTTHFFSNKMLRIFSPILTQEVGQLMRTILAHSRDGRPIPVRAHLHSSFTNIISLMIFGDERASQTDIIDLVVDMLHLLASFNLSDFLPYLGWLDLQGHAKASKLLDSKVKNVFQTIINDRRQEHQDGSKPTQDLLDTLLSMSLSNNDIQLTDNDIAAILMNLFLGGIDTSALAIEWALIELLANPEKLTFAKDELQKVVGISRLVQESDIPHLSYLQVVVKETFRLHPVGPLLMPHYSTQPCRVLDFEIPRNTMAFVNVWAIGRDPDLWENSLKFVPERFLGSNIDVRGRHFELLPFGCGRRACPALSLGLNITQLVLANLIHCFDWEKVGELDLSENFNIVLESATPLIASAQATMASHILEEQL